MSPTQTRGLNNRSAHLRIQENDSQPFLQSTACSCAHHFDVAVDPATDPSLRPILYRRNFRLYKASGFPAGAFRAGTTGRAATKLCALLPVRRLSESG